jgi:DNA-binding NarL/FixJ family response regulator
MIAATQIDARDQRGGDVQIVFADDHVLVRESVTEHIRRLEADVDVIQVGSLDAAVAAVTPATDLIILDLQMPGMNGLEGFDRMKASAGDCPIVILSGFTDKRTVNSLLERGAAGFIPKTASGKTLQRAIQAVLDGERYIPALVVDGGDGPSPFTTAEDRSAGPPADSPFLRLTEREAEIMRLLIAGKSNKQIAIQLGLQEITVKIHLRNAYRKIGAGNRADAVRMSYEQNFVELKNGN